MDNKFGDVTLKILSKEIRKAEMMICYAEEFMDDADKKTSAIEGWSAVACQLRCLRGKLIKAYCLIEDGIPVEKVEELYRLVKR